ncbi:MAG: hypothetical protein AAGI17_04305 [Planctomycetota bacterium]
MAPLPKIRSEPIAALAADLRFSARAATIREIERAAALAGEIEPDAGYPLEWVVFRVTGYRPDAVSDDVVEGAELLQDLSALVERLSESAKLRLDECPEGSRTLDELADDLGVSRKTVDRWRRGGLVARRVRAETKHPRLVVTPGARASFAARSGESIERAVETTRISDAESAKIIRRARRYADRFRCNRNQAAKRLAERFGRSHEGVRLLLERHDAAEREREGGRPIFDPPRRSTGRARTAALRAFCRGEDWDGIAEAMGEPNAAKARVKRIVLGARTRLVRRIDLDGPASADFESDGFVRALLDEPVVRAVSERVTAHASLAAQLEAARAAPSIDAGSERSLATAMHLLRWRAARAIASIDGPVGRATDLDRVETDLRWAGLLRSALIESQRGTVIKALDSACGEVESLGPGEALSAWRDALTLVGRVIDRASPFRGAKLAAAVSVAMGPVAAKLQADRASQARQLLSAQPSVDVLRLRPSVFWRPTLTPPARVGASEVLAMRWGLDGSPPCTLDELATRLGVTRIRAAVIEREELRRWSGLDRRDRRDSHGREDRDGQEDRERGRESRDRGG